MFINVVKLSTLYNIQYINFKHMWLIAYMYMYMLNHV